MDKHSYSDGFTLIEMLVVLFVIVLCMMLFPLMHIRRQGMGIKMASLYEHLLYAQTMAMRHGKEIQVTLNNDELHYADQIFKLEMRCQGEVLFHPNGNVDRARTITCHSAAHQVYLVIQLGSGRMYVR